MGSAGDNDVLAVKHAADEGGQVFLGCGEGEEGHGELSHGGG